MRRAGFAQRVIRATDIATGLSSLCLTLSAISPPFSAARVCYLRLLMRHSN